MIANVMVLSGIIFLISIQFVLIVAYVLHCIPLTSVLPRTVYPEWQFLIRPEREAFLFQMFVALSLVAQWIVFKLAGDRLSQQQWFKKLIPYAVFQAIAVVLLLSAAFKMTVFSERSLFAQYAFVVLTVVIFAIQMFWAESLRFGNRLLMYVINIRTQPWMSLAFVALIFLVIYIPDGNAALARMFFGEQFHHIDTFFMAPAWGWSKGSILNVDIMTEYGIGMPIMTGWLAKLFGGVTYVNVFYVCVWATIIYFAFSFMFLRQWLGSLGISVIVLLFALKIQMFHPGIDPFIFTLPSASVARYWWDIVFFICLLAHIRSGLGWWLLAAGTVCGISIFYMTTFGYCLGVAFALYLIMLAICPSLRIWVLRDWKGWLFWLCSGVLVPMVAVALFYRTQGAHLWTSEFARNMAEFNDYFLAAFGLMPMTETLEKKDFWANAMGFVIPAVYVLTLTIIAARIYFNRAPRKDVLAVILSFYGLAMYHYYVARSAPTSYYVVAIPYALILGFWLQKIAARLSARTARIAIGALAVAALYALFTTHTLMKYPNLLCLSSKPVVDPQLIVPLPDGRSYFNQLWTKIPEADKLPKNSLGATDEDLKFEKDFASHADLNAYYLKEFDFTKDAKLIARLTNPAQPAAVLSSFEIKLLMQADRKPYFYYSPILLSRPMRMRTFPNSTMYSLNHAQRILHQLEQLPPKYIFMENVFSDRAHLNLLKDASLQYVLQYIFAHYVPAEEGKYLTAWVRQ